MRQSTTTLAIHTRGRRLYDITRDVRSWVEGCGMTSGLLTLYIQHTSASLLINENYDPDVISDLERFFARLVPDGDPLFEHTLEGPDDMPAHVRTALTQTHLSIPLLAGKLALGTWQGIYLYEHRTHAMARRVILHLIGE
ncbi:MAG: secondary thiamine-phosphate synthase enzyme YjbQ [Methylophilaceae bacterium]|nr:secondary thiamine-phosphate synthase enzyme YjbQ [Methylophilaceae bacterium]